MHRPHPPRSGRGGDDRGLRELRSAALLAPLVLIAIFEAIRLLVAPSLSPVMTLLLAAAAALAGSAAFYYLVLVRAAELQRRLRAHNRELLALHQAGLAVSRELALDVVLQTVVDNARELLGARYGALSVVDEEGRVLAFLTSGIDPELRQRIGAPPQGKGLLGVVLSQGKRLRLREIAGDPRATGFPPHHPVMRTLLVMPVTGGPYRGNLYLADKADGEPFTADEEETLARFANQASIAIDNAHLHQEVRELAVARERVRIAQEMSDGLAQVLAYVNTKTQVVGEHCRQGDLAAAERHLGELAEAARGVYADVRAQILELRAPAAGETGLAQALSGYVAAWQGYTQLQVDLDLPAEELDLPPDVELQLLRITQEALTNVRKHARASNVRVAIWREPSRVRLLVDDDGVGFDRNAAKGASHPRFGLNSMLERAESLGGALTIDSQPEEGTRLEVVLPVSTAADKENAHAPVDS
ncbi:MAG TPA: GAF domain-containing sensor histidine kinase [Thermoanaerobaculia bacterium]|nr:GAF domain-containing sensor histidine kinase [Thermoanaerobaculia bacterium]